MYKFRSHFFHTIEFVRRYSKRISGCAQSARKIIRIRIALSVGGCKKSSEPSWRSHRNITVRACHYSV